MGDVHQAGSNSESVLRQHAEEILAEIRSSSRSWMKVAELCVEVDNVLGKDKAAKTDFAQQVGLTYPTLRKLVRVAKSNRLKMHKEQLALVDSWTTLHAIDTLTDEPFKCFAEEYLQGGEARPIRRVDVERCKPRTKGDRSGSLVRINTDKIETLEELQQAKRDLRQIEEISARGRIVVDLRWLRDQVTQVEQRLGATMPAAAEASDGVPGATDAHH